MTLVHDPYQCQNCEVAVFCKICLESLKRKTECPSCRADPFNYVKLNRFGQRLLDSSLVSCPNSDCKDAQNLSYENLFRHLELNCPQVKILCPSDGCGIHI